MYSLVGTDDSGLADAFHWIVPFVKGTQPSPRNEHTCVVADSYIYVFGGFDESGSLNDIHIYDTSTCMWTKSETTGKSPTTRYGNSMVLVDRKIYIFGGMVGGNTFVFGGVPNGLFERLFSAKTKGNVEMIEEPENDTFTLDIDSMVWEELIVKGNIPSKRCGHTVWLQNDDNGHRMMIFGGWGENGVRFNDLHSFDIEHQIWNAVKTNGTAPSPRCGLSASRVGNSVYIFGGWGQDGRALGDFHVLNLLNMTWSLVKATGSIPPGRTGHSSVVVGDKIYIYGGDAADNFYDDVSIFDTKKSSWTTATTAGKSPGGVSRHAACLVGADMYIVGGWDHDFFYNDIYYLKTELSSSQARRSFAFKAVIVGDSGVGKTSIISRLTDDRFSDQTTSTIGVDNKIVHIEVHNNSIKLQLWDTAGQERFSSIASSYYRGSHGIIFVYDITNPTSFDRLLKWTKDVEKTVGLENVVALIVGNKSDLSSQRKVDVATAKRFAMSNNMLFIETSAKDAFNIDRAFEMLCSEIIDNADRVRVSLEESKGSAKLVTLGESGRNVLERFQDSIAARNTNSSKQYSAKRESSCCGGGPKISDDY